MKLYIMRHGIAYDTSEWNGSEFDRPLTDEGLTRTHEILKTLKASGELTVDAIWSSPLARARQTAEIAAAVLGLNVKIVDSLQCGADLRDIMKYALKYPPPNRLMTVGHEPDCGLILSELTGIEDGDLEFKRAGIAHMEGDLKPGSMKLIWKYAPKDVLGD
ncbi:MAG: phosphohistidine phosphatase SixA [Planctomycetota bacterium]